MTVTTTTTTTTTTATTATTANPQFTLYVHDGPNPWKVTIILEELGMTYKTIYVSTKAGDNKRAPYTTLNPNGRMPTLIDHSNNDFIVWESGAIILYLIEKYDTIDHKLSFESFEDNTRAKQFLMFQMSGQGPYFGQLGWFKFFHPEKVPSAEVRYANEVRRVLGVLADIVKGKQYLGGDKISYADLSFLPWLWIIDNPSFGGSGWKDEEELKELKEWYERLNERESVKVTREIKALVGPGITGSVFGGKKVKA